MDWRQCNAEKAYFGPRPLWEDAMAYILICIRIAGHKCNTSQTMQCMEPTLAHAIYPPPYWGLFPNFIVGLVDPHLVAQTSVCLLMIYILPHVLLQILLQVCTATQAISVDAEGLYKQQEGSTRIHYLLENVLKLHNSETALHRRRRKIIT